MDSPVRAVGRYLIYDPIASGGMATVHLGKLRGPVGFSRTVAIKRLHPHLAGDAGFVRAFVDEAHVAARIRHPNVVPTLDVVADGGELFLVLEYVEGESLSRLLNEARARGEAPPLRVMVAIVCDVLHGLHGAHEATDEHGEPLGIVHRDVSPQNVLVAVDGTARVLDFGVAKARRRLSTTQDGALKGKIAYMAPEQIGGEATRASDVYAAAVILWEGITLRRPFEAENEAALMAQIITTTPPVPSSLAKAPLPEPGRARLDAIVMRGLARDSALRFATALEMAAALEAGAAPATRAEVAEWLRRSAGEALRERSLRVKDLESDVTIPGHPDSKVTLDSLRGPAISDDATTRVAPKAGAVPVEGELSAGPVVTSAPARRPVRVAATVACVALFAAALGYGALHRSSASAPPPPDASSATVAGPCTVVTDCPAPATSSADARAAYQAGLQSLRDASFNAARSSFERAVTFDAGFAAAHLRLALMSTMFNSETNSRRLFARAEGLRTSLAERDRALLDAFEPYFHADMGDVAECAARLDVASSRAPRDSELAFYLGFLRFQQGQLDAAVTALDRAIDIDPELGEAWSERAGAMAFQGRFDEATRSLDHCIQMSPLATDCLWYRAALDEAMGRCGDVEADAKLAISKEPDNYFGYSLLANALVAEGRSGDAIDAALQEKWAKTPAKSRPRTELHDRMNLELLAGRFGDAERHAHELESSSLGTDPSIATHAVPALALVGLYTETGRPTQARDVARAFLEREGAWTAPFRVDDVALARDAVPRMLATLEHTGAIGRADLRTRRAEWLDAWKKRTSGAYLHHLWLYGFAAGAETKDDADDALAALPEFLPLPAFAPQSVTPAFLGKVYVRAGRDEDAVAPLRAATASCVAMRYPMDYVRAYLDLGAALESSDPKAACAAYGTVVRRWGASKPKSVTATEARKRMAALYCATR